MKQFFSRKSVLFLLVGMIITISPLTSGAMAQQADETVPRSDPPAPAEPGLTAQTVAALEQRVKNLEQEIIDLRTMIGTYASMGRGPAGSSGNNNGRTAPSSDLPWGAGEEQPTQPRQQGRFGEPSDGSSSQRPKSALTLPPVRPDVREDGVVADQLASRQEEEAALPEQQLAPQPDPSRNPSSDPGQDQMKKASIGPAIGSKNSDAQSLYNDAYSHMLRRDYAAAQSAFGALIKNHPQSRMAGNAQYWLGETFYVRGKYRPAADAFLKAYRNYSSGIKAPDSLMKLAFSLARLGQKAAACKTFDELNLKFPNAPNHVKQRAGMERRRTGCN